MDSSVVSHGMSIVGVALSGNGQVAATCDAQANISLWNAGSGDLYRTLKAFSAADNLLCFTDDDKYLIAVESGRRAQMWRVATGQLVLTLSLPDSRRCSALPLSERIDLP